MKEHFKRIKNIALCLAYTCIVSAAFVNVIDFFGVVEGSFDYSLYWKAPVFAVAATPIIYVACAPLIYLMSKIK